MQNRNLPDLRRPSTYEREALAAIKAWRQPSDSWLRRQSIGFQESLNGITDQVRKVPGVDWTIDNVVTGLLNVTNEITQDLVWQTAIFQVFRDAGHENVHTADDIAWLDLEIIDVLQEGTAGKYKSLAAVEGVATGMAGWAGILPDIIALIALCLRAAGEYATYYGFDIAEPSERLYALHILDAAAKPRERIALSIPEMLHETPNKVARKKTLRTVERVALGGTVSAVAKSIALRITRNKLAQVLPIAGAVVAGSFNSIYTGTVCDVAYHLYRERFLYLKYGRVL